MDSGSTSVENAVISILANLVEEWGVDHAIGRNSQLVADLEFESIDIIQLVVAIEQHFKRRNMGFDQLLMVDGKYVDDLSVRQIAEFVESKIS